ncbi:MAG: succinylglutamate desuccinylase/aspartoacylase family protein [Deltaproteobacteria bacterium]|nr:succinylglutamate desuccinylase/aspartoacylase family protein [Deltaproteobacteria bacterium]MBI3294744.1 succinylglutamate desuccinylase/aspartoacylase family protein [Deltaproteobacteria bacterium]
MKLTVLGFFFVTAICLAGDWADSDSGIHGPKYSELLTKMQQLADQNTDRTLIFDYGQTAQGRTLRLLALYRHDLHPATRPTLYITGSIHGNEYLNIEDRLPETIITQSKGQGTFQKFIDTGGAVVFVPIVNPDGYDLRQRENTHDTDLNRDWDVPPANFKGFTEVETGNLSSKLDELGEKLGLRYRVTVDYHCCAGALLYPWSYETETTLPPDALKEHQAMGQLAQSILGKDVEHGTTGQILGYYPMGTTKDYFYDHYKSLSFTYEGRYGQENEYFDKHVQWWQAITEQIMKEVHHRSWMGVAPREENGLFHL